jgi:hypothetical protein
VAASATSRLRVELERRGATFRKGRPGYIAVTDYGQMGEVALSGPAYEEPRQWWRGSSMKALELIVPLPDGVDLAAIWLALHAVP